VALPAATPVARPDDGSIDNVAGLLLVHVPPAGLLVRFVVASLHISITPPIVVGNGFTVNDEEIPQPVPVII